MKFEKFKTFLKSSISVIIVFVDVGSIQVERVFYNLKDLNSCNV